MVVAGVAAPLAVHYQAQAKLRDRDALLQQQTDQLDGGAHRAYGFADGHSEIHKAVDGNFQPWEQQHMIPPPRAGQAGN
jgi:hypothetical protein